MKTSKVVREEIAALYDRVQAVIDIAAGESRDLSAEEKTEIDGIQGSGKPGEAGYNAGQIGKLESDLARLEKVEARQTELLKARGVKPTQATEEDEPSDKPRASTIAIPRAAAFRGTGKLKAFKGEHGDREAYLSGMWILGTLGRNERAAKWCKDHGVDVTFRGAMSESSNTLGGFLVPEEMEQRIIDLREQYGVFAGEAYSTTMSSDTKSVPRRASGLTAYFVAEAGTITASDKGWDRVSLVAKKLACLARYSSEVSEDSIINLADDLAGEMAYAFAKKEDECGFIGDGTSTYGGIVGVTNAVAAGSIYTAISGNTGFETLDLADFEAMVGKLPQYAENGAKWYISKAGYAASMMRLIDAAGGNTSAQLQGGPSAREFLGYPVVISQVLNSTLGADVSANKLLFGNLKMAATMGRRRGMSVDMADQLYFTTDELAIRGTERFDINVHEVGTASIAGPILVLATPGS